jgi:hypothetical protein
MSPFNFQFPFPATPFAAGGIDCGLLWSADELKEDELKEDAPPRADRGAPHGQAPLTGEDAAAAAATDEIDFDSLLSPFTPGLLILDCARGDKIAPEEPKVEPLSALPGPISKRGKRGRPAKEPAAGKEAAEKKPRIESMVQSMTANVTDVLNESNSSDIMVAQATRLDADVADVFRSFEKRTADNAGTVPVLNNLRISTMTIEVELSGPAILPEVLCEGLTRPDVVAFNDAHLGFQPVLRNKAFHHAIIIKIANVAVKVFYTKVKLHITGVNSVASFVGVANYFRRLFEILHPGQTYRMEKFSVHLINTDMRMARPISLHTLNATLRSNGGKQAFSHNPTVPIIVSCDLGHHSLLRFLYPASNQRLTSVQVASSGAVVISNSSKGGSSSSLHNRVRGCEFVDTVEFVFTLFARHPEIWAQIPGGPAGPAAS